MKNTLKKLSLLPVCLFMLLLNSCDVKPVEIVSIDGVKINKINEQGVEIDITVTLKNPNNMRFTVTGADLVGDLNGISLGDIKLENKVRIPRNSEKSHTFRVSSSVANILAGGISSVISAFTKGAPTVKIKGDLKVRSWLMTRRFPIEFTKKIPLNFGK